MGWMGFSHVCLNISVEMLEKLVAVKENYLYLKVKNQFHRGLL